jgi:DNA polymerase-3 subunit epsilon
MREIVLDTETTGISAADGHRLVEIGCVELDNHVPTGRVFHEYLNPQREVDAGALEVHGLSNEFLSDKPLFADIADRFLEFVGNAPLVIHNAAFDMGFLNAELKRLGRPPLPDEQAIDTLAIARRKFAGAQNSLDALCRRFGIDNSNRTKHGALLDSELLAEVYLELVGGRQFGLGLAGQKDAGGEAGMHMLSRLPKREPRPKPLSSRLSEAERESHAAFVASFGAPALWTSSKN